MLFHDSNAVFRPLPWRGIATGAGLRHTWRKRRQRRGGRLGTVAWAWPPRATPLQDAWAEPVAQPRLRAASPCTTAASRSISSVVL